MDEEYSRLYSENEKLKQENEKLKKDNKNYQETCEILVSLIDKNTRDKIAKSIVDLLEGWLKHMALISDGGEHEQDN